jgi:tetratricopeptide (TPR) repeat protein/energy-coupling factor transporter ATP-binding protein EcfA2
MVLVVLTSGIQGTVGIILRLDLIPITTMSLNFFNKNSTGLAVVVSIVALVYKIFWYDRRKDKTGLPNPEPLTIPSRRVYEKLPAFTGRKKALNKIHKALTRTNHVLLTGVGGIGKSTLIRQYIATNRSFYSSVVYIEYDNSSLQGSLIDGLIYPYRRVRTKDKYEEAIKTLHNTGSLSCLFVIDNFDPGIDLQASAFLPRGVFSTTKLNAKNARKIKSEHRALNDLLGRLDNWRVLVVSRASKEAFVGAGLKSVRLKGLSANDAELLFGKYWHNTESDIEAHRFLDSLPAEYRSKRGKLSILLKNIAYHTLTIEIMAKTLQNDGSYELFDHLYDFSSDITVKAAYRKGSESKEFALNTLLDKIFKLSSMDKYDVKLLQTIAFFSSPDVGQEVLEILICDTVTDKNHTRFIDGVTRLVERGWVSRNIYPGDDEDKLVPRLSCHKIIQLFVEHDEAHPIKKQYTRLAATLLRQLNKETPLKEKEQLLPYIERLIANDNNLKDLLSAYHISSKKIHKWRRYWQQVGQTFGSSEQDDSHIITWLSKAIELDPHDILAYGLRAMLEVDTGDYVTAEKDCIQALKLSRKSNFGLESYLHIVRAYSYEKQKNYSEALTECKLALKTASRSRDQALAYVQRAEIQYLREKDEEAEHDLRKAEEIHPPITSYQYKDRTTFYALLGRTLYYQKQYKAACDAFDRDIEQFPEQSSETYYLRACARDSSNLFDKVEAIKDLDKAIDMRPEFAKAYWRRGHIKEDIGRAYTECIADISKGHELESSLYCRCHFPKKLEF